VTEEATATPQRTLTINATVAFVLAGLVNSLLHECAHAVAGLVLGLVPTITPFSVSYVPEGTAGQQTVTAAAGPLFSLVMGLVLMVAARRWGRGFGRLVWMFLAFMGVMNFVGYCFIAPFARVGDTGQVLTLLGAPEWVFIVVGLVGVAGQFWLARRFAVEVKRYATEPAQQRQIAYFPWLIGTSVVVLLALLELIILQLPAPYLVLILAYSVAFGVFAPMQFIFSRRVHNTLEPLSLAPVPVAGLVLTGLLAVVGIALVAIGGLRVG
jgi:hypothetical protein